MTLRSFVACAFAAVLPAVAVAQQASTLNAVAMRSGPDSGYPLVASYGPGTPLRVQGCVEGYAWCDVIGPYWAAHYPHRAWYREHASWEVYQPVVRPAPVAGAVVVHPVRPIPRRAAVVVVPPPAGDPTAPAPERGQ